MATGWACLPELVFNLILHKLPSLPDHVRFASVCTTWSWAAKNEGPKLLTDLFFLTPTFNVPGNPTLFEEKTLLYNVGEKKTYCTNFPFSRCGPVVRFCGFSHGWLVMLHKDYTITLYKPTPNPTKQATDTIRLPPIYGTDTEPIALNVTLSADPTTSDRYTAVATYSTAHNLAIWTSGDKNWTRHIYLGTSFFSPTWCKNKLYALTSGGKVVHIDDFLSEKPRLITVCDYQYWALYLAESWRGELLMITGKRSRSSIIGFKVHKLEESGGGVYNKVEVEELGGDALFLMGDSLVVAVGALGTRRQDCIYDISGINHTLNIFCLDSGKCETRTYHHANSLLFSDRLALITFAITPLLSDWV